jgi:Antitoxin-like ribbon-helix-helix
VPKLPARSEPVRRKLVTLEPEVWQALDVLARDRFASFQELADEAFRDLLRKYHRPAGLREALRQSVKQVEAADGAPEARKPHPRKRGRHADVG